MKSEVDSKTKMLLHFFFPFPFSLLLIPDLHYCTLYIGFPVCSPFLLSMVNQGITRLFSWCCSCTRQQTFWLEVQEKIPTEGPSLMYTESNNVSCAPACSFSKKRGHARVTKSTKMLLRYYHLPPYYWKKSCYNAWWERKKCFLYRICNSFCRSSLHHALCYKTLQRQLCKISLTEIIFVKTTIYLMLRG